MKFSFIFIFMQGMAFVYVDSFMWKKLFNVSDWFSWPVLTCIILCLVILFLICFNLLQRRNQNKSISQIEAEQNEAHKHLELIENQTVNLLMEKYKMLSDICEIELELISKTKELEQLIIDKNSLMVQSELICQKCKTFEVSTETSQQEDRDLQYVILEDLSRLFSKQTSNDNLWAEKFKKLNKSFIDKIIEKGGGDLSVSYLKYCICFAIGMTTNEIADCFNIEQASVHMLRYRLKKKIGLNNEDDLNKYLQGYL